MIAVSVDSAPRLAWTSEDLEAVRERAYRQAKTASDYRAWKNRNVPDEMDRVWANYQQMVSLIQRAPFPPKRTARSWDLRWGRKEAHVPAETVLTFVGRDPEKHTRSDRIHW